ncbi:heterogeneous nuclear ribonucleoprotein U-like protein 2 isoform X1 [Solanum pennellii]|uniref:Heterogeneous nuclear ribonucleoprotein U-like protein 2 isoform X1 n=1 Tax=Solanum pennellii TaxID=28526 RepID=A0ABM1G0L7_SOLPN|nr:heterogeneous nuclear ribonucleoprotein U-like protein 2 isoform X1 [Solanum pennellii]
MASRRRDFFMIDEVGAKKKAKVDEAEEEDTSQLPVVPWRVLLNAADCDLDFNVEGNGLLGSGLYEHGFSYCWSGARANMGITGGKYCFGCKIVAEQPVKMDDTPLDQQQICRVGISRGDDAVGNLGETLHSFGFVGTGKFSSQGRISNYGERFGVGDTIICCVDLESSPMASIGFSKNGKWLGTSKQFNAGPGPTGLEVVDCPMKNLYWHSALFPHVLLKNVVVNMQFSINDGLAPVEGYKPWSCAMEDGKAIPGPSFANLCDCEAMMMVGLPASGKSTWAEKWIKEHPEKRYVLLGTNLALDLMKVPGFLRKQNYCGRFEHLMDRATGIFNTLLSRASKIPRNFIIDQTNVHKNARKRKLKPFANYKKIAVVIVPTPEELKFRGEKLFKEMGKKVPAEAVNQMLVNFVLPMSKDMHQADEYFDEVRFEELGRAEAQRCLDEMKANLNSEKEVTPYSRESSMQSHNSLSMQYPLEYQQSCSGSSPQSLRNVPGGRLNSSYAQPQLQAPHESFYAIPSSYNPIGDFGHHGSHSAYGDSRGYDMEARSAIHGEIYEPHVGSGAQNAAELHQSIMNDPNLRSVSGGSGAQNAAELHQSSMNDPNLSMSGGFGAWNAAELHQSSMNDPNLRMSGGFGAQNAAELHQSSMNDPNLREMFGGSGAQNAAELHQSSMNDPNLRMSGGFGAWNAAELHQSSMNDPNLSMSGGFGAWNAAELLQSSMNDPNLSMSGGFGAQSAAELHHSSMNDPNLSMSGGFGAWNAAELLQSSMNDPNLSMSGGFGAQSAAELHQSSMNDPYLRMSGGSGYLPPDSRGPFESGMATPYGFRSVFPAGFSQEVPAPRPQHENYPSGAQHPGVSAPQGVPAPWPPHENYPSGAQHPGVYAPPGPRYY